jgi:hypothetical protein
MMISTDFKILYSSLYREFINHIHLFTFPFFFNLFSLVSGLP